MAVLMPSAHASK